MLARGAPKVAGRRRDGGRREAVRGSWGAAARAVGALCSRATVCPPPNLGMKLTGGRRRRRSGRVTVGTNARRRLGQRHSQKCARPQLMPCRYRAELAPINWGIRPGAGRAVFLGGVNSGSPWRPLLLFPWGAQAESGAAGASPCRVAALGWGRLKGVWHVALSRRTPYRVLQSE